MESNIKTSFIPTDARDTVVAAPSLRSRSGGLSDLFLLAAVVLCIASLALGGGVFLYRQYLATSSESKQEQLRIAKAAFEPSLIQELTRLDDRMRAADQVLTAHVAPSILLHLFEQLTLQTVSFSSLDFQAVDPQNITIDMKGIARSVNSIALEADLLSKSGVISSPIFSDINRQPDGVRFNLSALVNPTALRYSQNLQAQQQAAAAAATAPETPAGPVSPFESGQVSGSTQ